MPHLIVFSHLRWDFVYQRPQHLLSRLAKHHDVLFIEEPVHDDGPARIEVSSPAASLTVLRPHTGIAASGFHDQQIPVLEYLLEEYLRANEIRDSIVWLYTPMALPLVALLQPRAVIFDCMDELSAFKDAPRQLRQREGALMRAADLVLTGGPSLYEAKRSLHHNVLCLPSAVDTQHYSPRSAIANRERARDSDLLQAHLPHPRLGFFGVIDERLDLDLVAALADADANWQVVMVGPVVKIDPARLPQRSNIAWLGQQPYELLPSLVHGWDVCLLPFAINAATRFISPTKTLEYMAAEKAVVSTPVPDVVGLYGDVVRVCTGREAFIEGCRSALRESAEARRTRVRAMRERVARYSWDRTADRILSAIRAVLEPEAGRSPTPGTHVAEGTLRAGESARFVAEGP